ncbi:hypothetical protein VE03_00628 [Pseudogymnoascus sp. 23342-1-I1]|nr:hypothetical protein VE03_00628 [Pseudogymnoascus sp. 23342-1-I1]
MSSSSSPPPPHHNLLTPKRPLLPPSQPATHKSYTVPLPSRAELQPSPPTTTTAIPPLTFHAAHPHQPFLDPSLLPKRRVAAQEAQAAQERLATGSGRRHGAYLKPQASGPGSETMKRYIDDEGVVTLPATALIFRAVAHITEAPSSDREASRGRAGGGVRVRPSRSATFKRRTPTESHGPG